VHGGLLAKRTAAVSVLLHALPLAHSSKDSAELGLLINMSLYSHLINEYAAEPSNLNINAGTNELRNNNNT
jgi:hypothetical protein